MPHNPCTYCDESQLDKLFQQSTDSTNYIPWTGPCPFGDCQGSIRSVVHKNSRRKQKLEYNELPTDPNIEGTNKQPGADAGNVDKSIGIAPEAQNRAVPPRLPREFKGQVGDMGMGFYQDEYGNVEVGLGRVVEVTVKGVFIGPPVHAGQKQDNRNTSSQDASLEP